MQNKHDVEEFMAILSMFATNSKIQLNQPMIRVYDKAVSAYGYDKALAAITELMNETKVWQMPTPKQIIDKIQAKQSPSEQANEIVGLIFESIPLFGYMRSQQAREKIGQIGWSIVKQFGGWSYLCQELGITLNKATTRAQMRDLAVSLLSKPQQQSNALELSYDKREEIPSFVKMLSEGKAIEK